jgi:hypothetical protein
VKYLRTMFPIFLLGTAFLASAQDKPRVFVQGKGSENVSSNGSSGGGRHWGTWGSKSTVDSHDESMEVTKDLQKNCSGVTLTINQTNADYIVMMNRESKQNRGLLRTNSQIQVANRAGDILGSNATRTVGNAAKDACGMIVADWTEHGRLDVPSPEPTAAATPTVQPAVTTGPGAPVPVPVADVQQKQPAANVDAQKAKCLELAKDNPSITCK